jgi:hypothetical protein
VVTDTTVTMEVTEASTTGSETAEVAVGMDRQLQA